VAQTVVEELRASRADEIVWIGRVPARVDFLQSVPGVDFASSWSRRATVDIGGIPVTFIGREDLIMNGVGPGIVARIRAILDRAQRRLEGEPVARDEAGSRLHFGVRLRG